MGHFEKQIENIAKEFYFVLCEYDGYEEEQVKSIKDICHRIAKWHLQRTLEARIHELELALTTPGELSGRSIDRFRLKELKSQLQQLKDG